MMTANNETSMPETNSLVQRACDIATGKIPADPDATGYRTVGAKKDLNSRGNGPEWYQMVYRAGTWRYISDERLPRGSLRAAERRATVYGDVYEGEITITHDRGKGVDSEARLVVAAGEHGGEDPSRSLRVECPVVKTRDGGLKITLPDGSEIKLPNPRR